MKLLRLKKEEIKYLNLSKSARQMRTIEFENYINLDKMTIKHDVINKFKENNYEFLINHEKYEITIRDIKLEKDFIILKFAPIVELYTFIEYLNSLDNEQIIEIINILNVVDHEILVIKEKNKKHITFRRHIIKNNVHQATNYLTINLHDYVINNYNFELNIVLNKEYQELMKTRCHRIKYKVLSINLCEFLYVLENEENKSIETLINN